jgi:hypothetical protein
MAISTNVSKPPKKKKTTTVVGLKVTSEKPTAKQGTMTPSTEKKVFKPADVRTGDKRYGKESATNPTPGFVKKAQGAKVDIATKDGKDYRAGYTTTQKEPAKFASVQKLPKVKAKLDIRTNVETDKVKSSKSKTGKLKAMAMTYGTDSPKKGGGTKYKKKVKAKK